MGRLTTAPVLAHFNEEFDTLIQTDASHEGLGAVLMQDDGESGIRPVCFISRRLTDAETRYHSNELECLAVVWAVKKLRVYTSLLRPTLQDSDGQLSRKVASQQERPIRQIRPMGPLSAGVSIRNKPHQRSR